MVKITDFIKKYLFYIICAVVGLVAGYLIGQHFIKPVTIEKPPVIKTEYQTETKTQVVYVPKEPGEKTDLEANIGKQELNVKVNGKDAVIQKADDEQYIFDKNKIVLDQTSKATIDINVPTIDKTKHLGIGAGFGNHGIAYTLTIPVNKKLNTDGWAYHDSDTTAAGIMIRF